MSYANKTFIGELEITKAMRYKDLLCTLISEDFLGNKKYAFKQPIRTFITENSVRFLDDYNFYNRTETIVKLNDVAVNCLVDQLKEKDKQIQELHRLIENSQILLKQEQKNCENQMQLEEHFKEVDKKLETLKAKMEDRREKKRFSFFKRST